MRNILKLSSLALALLLALSIESQIQALPYFIEDLPIPGFDIFDTVLQDLVPIIAGQKPNKDQGNTTRFKELLLRDKDDFSLNHMTAEELIKVAGFKIESYRAVADDGYITSLTRIINPLADRSKLKWPPVLLLHGGTIDTSCYLFASTKKHHPEHYPPNGEPMTSWNRSMAFFLSNRGYDVWLAETRGSNEFNMDHIQTDALKAMLEKKNVDKNMTLGENVQSVLDSFNYWSFSQDDIIEHEIKSYIDKICQVLVGDQSSVARPPEQCKVNMLSFSLSTPMAFAFLSTRPDYAKEKIHRFVVMAPTIYKKGIPALMKLALSTICPLVPNSMGTMVIWDFIVSGMRRIILVPSIWKKLRYSNVKAFTTLQMGPSSKYRTWLELNVLHHLMRMVGFKQGKQMCQQMSSNRLQKYDYGPIKNKKVYGTELPPEYDISNLLIEPYLLITGENDILATPKSVQTLMEQVNPKPYKHIVGPSFNHLDLVAAVENDKYVNFPLLEYFDEFAIIPGQKKEYKQNYDLINDSAFSKKQPKKNKKSEQTILELEPVKDLTVG